MLVLMINRLTKWCQITTGGRKYTCSTKEIDGELYFLFKKVWHPVSKYISEHADELTKVDGITILRKYKR